MHITVMGTGGAGGYFGARLGIATPCNRAVFDILSVHGEGPIASTSKSIQS